MPTPMDASNIYKKLRDRAEALLLAGTTPTAGHGSMGVDALRLLHLLSSDPDKADDALKLLHELQVHQVELDLQNEEIVANEHALEEDLGLYRGLYDHAPVGYLVVDLQGVVLQNNLAAAELFGVGHNDLEGQRIDSFLKPQNRAQMLGLLQRVAESGARSSCLADTSGGAQGGPWHLEFRASVPPGGEHILLVCCECGNTNNLESNPD